MVALKGLAMGIALIGVGAVIYRYAYAITRFSEQLDAIGSTRGVSNVEPATWNVILTKGLAALCFLLGSFFLMGAIWA